MKWAISSVTRSMPNTTSTPCLMPTVMKAGSRRPGQGLSRPPLYRSHCRERTDSLFRLCSVVVFAHCGAGQAAADDCHVDCILLQVGAEDDVLVERMRIDGRIGRRRTGAGHEAIIAVVRSPGSA